MSLKQQKHGKFYHPLTVALWKYGLALLLFALSRVLFYALNTHYFTGISAVEFLKIMGGGLRFDCATLIVLNSVFIFLNALPFPFRTRRTYRRIADLFFYIPTSIGMLANFADTIYFRFTLKRTTAEIFKYMGQGLGDDLGKLLPQFLRDFWYVALLWVLFVVALVWISNRFNKRIQTKIPQKPLLGYYLVNSVLFAATVALALTGVRGGVQRRPVGIITAGNYAAARNMPLVLNTPFSIYTTLQDKGLQPLNFFESEEALNAVYRPLFVPKPADFKPCNVLVIILESFSREHSGFLNKEIYPDGYKGFTPVLDSLIQTGLYFDAYANGKTSIQGVPAILTGIPSLLDEPVLLSPYSGNTFPSLANLLKAKGYTSAFFHGGTNGTMMFDNFTRATGFDRYVGRTEYRNEADFDGVWGIRDEEFLQFTAQQLNSMPKPFAASVFTLSSHHPYFVPKKYEGSFRKGSLQIQESIMYADYSLGKFFETVRNMPWYENTVFVITADHTSEGFAGYYKNPVGQYAVPLLFLFPDKNLTGISPLTAQQADIVPTVLSYLGYDKPFVSFGTNLLDTTAVHFSVHYSNKGYGLVKDRYFLEFDGAHATKLYDLGNDRLLKDNLLNKDRKRAEEMETFLKAYLQQYNNRMIKNQLVY